MFHEGSALVKTWVRLVRVGAYQREQVPKLDNLQEIVYQILEKEE